MKKFFQFLFTGKWICGSSERWMVRIAWAALLLCFAFLLAFSLVSCHSAKLAESSSIMENLSSDSCAVERTDSVGLAIDRSEAHSALRIDSVRFVAVAVQNDSVYSDRVPPWKSSNGRIINSAVAYGIRLNSSSFDWSLNSDSIAKSIAALSNKHKEAASQQMTSQSVPKENKAGQIVILCFLIVVFIAMAKVFFNADKL